MPTHLKIADAAFVCHVSEKTLRRAIRAGRLDAETERSGAYRIALEALRNLGLTVDTKRLDALEPDSDAPESISSRLERLERLFLPSAKTDETLNRSALPYMPKAAPAPPSGSSDTLPDGWLSLQEFAEAHAISMTTLKHNLDRRAIFVHEKSEAPDPLRGWKRGRNWIARAIDAEQRAAILRAVPAKVRCADLACPCQG